MRNNSKLLLNDTDDLVVIAHNSSLIDETFRKKYTQPVMEQQIERDHIHS